MKQFLVLSRRSFCLQEPGSAAELFHELLPQEWDPARKVLGVVRGTVSAHQNHRTTALSACKGRTRTEPSAKPPPGQSHIGRQKSSPSKCTPFTPYSNSNTNSFALAKLFALTVWPQSWQHLAKTELPEKAASWESSCCLQLQVHPSICQHTPCCQHFPSQFLSELLAQL